jgi:glycerol-3-phosphate dehydrogenase (NAD(P)+)
MLEMNMVVEGYYAVACINELNRSFNIRCLFATRVTVFLYDRISAALEMKLLTENLK